MFLFTEIMTETLKICENLPRPFRLWFGTTLVLFIEKAEDIQIILNSNSCLHKSVVYKFLHKDVALFTAPRKISFECFNIMLQMFILRSKNKVYYYFCF